MKKIVNINERGTVTLPKKMRDRLGFKGEYQIVAEETELGILLRPMVAVPVEIYSESRLNEFAKHNEGALAGLRLRKRK